MKRVNNYSIAYIFGNRFVIIKIMTENHLFLFQSGGLLNYFKRVSFTFVY